MPFDINNKMSWLGQGVRANVKGQCTGRLFNYDAGTDSFKAWFDTGYTLRVQALPGSTGTEGPHQISEEEKLIGMKHFYTQFDEMEAQSRGDYSFFFVFAGEDEMPLILIAQKNYEKVKAFHDAWVAENGPLTPPQPPPTKEPTKQTEPAEQTFDERDLDRDGVVSNKERRKAEKNK